jgi:Trm5-related predicted tRNA methylase
MRKPSYEDLELRIKQLEEKENESLQQTQNALKKIEWLLKPKGKTLKINNPDYGDLTNFNTNGLILKNIDKDVLKDIVQDYLVLLDTSAAIYEKNGD